MESVWKNTSETLPPNRDQVIVVGSYGTFEIEEGLGTSGPLVTKGFWNRTDGTWTVDHPTLGQQIVRGYGGISFWTELLTEFSDL